METLEALDALSIWQRTGEGKAARAKVVEQMRPEAAKFVEWGLKTGLMNGREAEKPLRTPEDVIGDALGVAMTLAAYGVYGQRYSGYKAVLINGGAPEDNQQVASLIMSHMLREQAVPYLWNYEMRMAALSLTLPEHRVRVKVPHPVM